MARKFVKEEKNRMESGRKAQNMQEVETGDQKAPDIREMAPPAPGASMEQIEAYNQAVDARKEADLASIQARQAQGHAQDVESDYGRIGRIGKEEVREATGILQKYKQGKANLEHRIVENEEWYKMRHWEQIRGKRKNDPQPASAWLFNSLANKHADAMDNYPEPNVLPRERGDEMDAEILSEIMPVILERNRFEQTYSDAWWYKLKAGSGLYGVFWNKKLEDGIGDIDIKQVDILNLFWEPGIKDIQESRNVFLVNLVDNDLLENSYPFLGGKLNGTSLDVKQYFYDDTVDNAGKSVVVDWYYKRTLQDGYGVEHEVLHYVKYVDDEIIYASENDWRYQERGYYDHGKYPFVFDVMFREEGTPAGFGYLDIMKDAQMYIDKLDANIMKQSFMASTPRWFIRDNANFNQEEFEDWTKPFIHVAGNIGDEGMRRIEVEPVSSAAIDVRQLKVDELKETSGNRDFSQGSTSSGVTAASAIAALQEAGSKLSRDMIKTSYRAFMEINYLAIELIRQFYTEERTFRITGEDGVSYVNYDNRRIQGNGSRRPVFDVKVIPQKASPFSKAAMNNMAMELYGAGFFAPQMADQSLAALEMMQFEGKDKIKKMVAQNGTLYQQLMQMQQNMEKMAAIIDAQNGTSMLQDMQGMQQGGQVGAEVERKQAATNNLGETKETRNTQEGRMRQQAAQASAPRT